MYPVFYILYSVLSFIYFANKINFCHRWILVPFRFHRYIKFSSCVLFSILFLNFSLASFILHRAYCIMYNASSSFILYLYLISCILYLVSCTMYPVSCVFILYPVLCILYPVSCISILQSVVGCPDAPFVICLAGDKPSENFKVMDIRESAQVGWETFSKPYLLSIARMFCTFYNLKELSLCKKLLFYNFQYLCNPMS